MLLLYYVIVILCYILGILYTYILYIMYNYYYYVIMFIFGQYLYKIILYNIIIILYYIIFIMGLTCPTVCVCLFKLRPSGLSKTLSHMWGKLNLPIFLFNVGLLTLMNMNSLTFLAKLCPSLPIIWKLLFVGWPVWLLCWWIGEGSFRCSLHLSPKGPGGFPYVFIIMRGHHIGTNIWPHVCWP